MKFLTSLLCLSCLFFANSTLLGQSVQRLPLPDFRKIEASTSLKIKLVQSDHNAIDLPLEATEEAFDVSENGYLELSGHSKAFPAGCKREVTIYFVDLDAIYLSGAMKLTADSMIQVNKLDIELSGASSIELPITTESLYVEVVGASKIRLSGSTAKLNIDCSGSSLVQASDLRAEFTEIDISGASKLVLNSAFVEGDITGASIITVNDDADFKNLDISGGAKIIREKSGEIVSSTIDIFDYEVDGLARFSSPSVSYKTSKKHPRFKAHWSGLEFGFAGYGNSFFSSRLPAGEEAMELALNKSAVVNWNIIDFSLPIARGFGLATGIGVGWNIYKFLDKSTLPGKLNGQFVASTYGGPEERDYKKSKLQSSWLRVPLLLEYQTVGRRYHKDFYVSAGVVGAVRMGASSKQIYSSDFDGRRKVKTKDDFYLAPFRADLEVRLGLGPIRLFATYGFTDLFLHNRGPKLNTYSFGICFFTY